MKPRILVIRGGAIGDFILTLPALGLLREAFPDAHLEVLGYKHIVALAEGRFYADATRSIEYGPMAGFFVPNADLAPELVEYFASFQQIISYLYDPSGFFEANLRRAGAGSILPAFARIDDSEHAARQLARPLQRLALYLDDHSAALHPTARDRAVADEFLAGAKSGLIAIHPGSGSVQKNWASEYWAAVAGALQPMISDPEWIVIAGEADEAQLKGFLENRGAAAFRVARDLPLPHLAAVLQRCRLFLGHDSGISHIAAAVGTPSVLLFGPTDPTIWAPANPHVTILQAPGDDLARLTPETVISAALARLAS